MARVMKLGPKRFGVVHDTTGKVIVRKGRRVIHLTRGAAMRDARKTRCRVTGKGCKR